MGHGVLVAENCRSCSRCKRWGWNFSNARIVLEKISVGEIKTENKFFFSLHFFPVTGLAKNEEEVHFKLD